MRIGWLALVLLVGSGGAALRGQIERPATVDCSVEGRALMCDRAEFLKRFAEARTLALVSQPRDRVADGQLASFSKSLGKQVVPAGPTNITLQLVRSSTAGFQVGPSDQELGSLRVFSTKDGESRLIWMERYRGQADLPWLVVVRSLTRQLQVTLAGQ